MSLKVTVLGGIATESVPRGAYRVAKLGIVVLIVRKGLPTQVLSSASTALMAPGCVSCRSYRDWPEHKRVCKLKIEQ